MDFRHVSAPTVARPHQLLSADKGRPDRFELIDTLRRAAPTLDIGAPVVATVDALLSCLPPKRNHDFVFASNATLVFRRNGISDRTLRRHIAELIERGLIVRIDSPNGKRYAKRDPLNGTVLRFGFDLAPLFAAFEKLCDLAHERAVALARLSYLRTKLRLAINQSTDVALVAHAQQALRRKLSAEDLESLLATLAPVANFERMDSPLTAREASQMTASNGQNVRHYQKSEEELNEEDAEKNAATEPESKVTLTIEELTAACPEAVSFLLEKPQTDHDVVVHARRLAPMMGIDRSCYESAERRHGSLGTAVTIWSLLELQSRIQHLGAYFRAITSGSRASSFCPWQLLTRLSQRRRKAFA
jgi:replication initiation protein RepC